MHNNATSTWTLARDATACGLALPAGSRLSGRVGRLRAYGNAIVPQVAAEFIKAYLEGEPQ